LELSADYARFLLVQGGVSGELSSMCPQFIQVGLPNEVHVFI